MQTRNQYLHILLLRCLKCHTFQTKGSLPVSCMSRFALAENLSLSRSLICLRRQNALLFTSCLWFGGAFVLKSLDPCKWYPLVPTTVTAQVPLATFNVCVSSSKITGNSVLRWYRVSLQTGLPEFFIKLNQRLFRSTVLLYCSPGYCLSAVFSLSFFSPV